MLFREGAMVYTADGQKVGDIEHFVLDPKAKTLVGLVVSKGLLSKETKVVPVDAVATTEIDRAELYTDVDPGEFPLYEETHYITPDGAELRSQYRQKFNESTYQSPSYGGALGYGAPAQTVSPPKIKERNIPEGCVPIGKNAKVISHDGKHIGDVKEVFAEADTHTITYITIIHGLLFKEEKLIPINWVNRIYEDEVYLAVSSDSIDKMDNT